MQIKTFNTGRQYSPEGQRIAYVVIAQRDDSNGMTCERDVAFVDMDRGINGMMTVFGSSSFPILDREVLAEYDAGGYGHISFAIADQLKSAFDV